MRIRLKYIGHHQTQEIIEVEPKKAKRLIARGDYILIDDDVGTITSVEKKEEPKEEKKDLKTRPTKYWTEKNIKNWIDDNKLPINYDPEKDTKQYALDEIEKYFAGD